MKYLTGICIGIAFTFLLFACHQPQPKGLTVKKQIHISFPEPRSDIPSYSAYIYNRDGREYIAYVSLVSKKIQLINIVTNTPEFTIPLNKLDSAFDFTFNKPKFFIHSLDSIFILPDESKTVFLLDRTGKILYRWNLSFTGQSNFVLSGYSSNPFMFYNGRVYIRYVPKINPFFQKSTYFTTSPELILDIHATENKITRGGGWPQKYVHDNYYDDYPYLCMNTGANPEQLVCSYAAEHDLYVYEGSNLVKKAAAKSKFIDEFELFKDDSIGNIEYTMKYIVTAPKYGRIIYDRYRNFYYRIAFHKTELVNDDGATRKGALDQPWSLIILNKNFEKLDEIKFDPAQYACGPMFVVKEGLMIPKRKPRAEEAKDVYDWNFVLFNVNF